MAMDFKSLFEGSHLRGRALLEHVVKHISKNPEYFDMGDWIQSKHNKLSCGTVGCLAGWTVMCTDKIRTVATAENKLGIELHERCPVRAAVVLEISEQDVHRLFFTCSWENEARYEDAEATLEELRLKMPPKGKPVPKALKKEIEAELCNMVRATVDEINLFIEDKKITDPLWYNYGKEPKKAARTRHA